MIGSRALIDATGLSWPLIVYLLTCLLPSVRGPQSTQHCLELSRLSSPGFLIAVVLSLTALVFLFYDVRHTKHG